MNLNKLGRALVAGLVGGVVASVSLTFPAYAAPSVPTPYPASSFAPIYLSSALTSNTYSPTAVIPWDGGADSVVASKISYTGGEPTDYEQFRLPVGNGGVEYVSFLSTQGGETNIANWKAWGSFSGPGSLGTGALLPNLAIGNTFTNGNASAVKTAGGLYSLGVAYMTNNQLTVTTAFFTTINVEAGTGDWTFATPAAPVVVTDVATTTTISAAPATLVAGESTLLKANVSATKPVSGNVTFFEGSTSLGTVALSAGEATKSVIVSTAGAHTYTASFVENQVSTGALTADKFLASTSAVGATVTATTPPAPVVPNAPSENAMNSATANGASASYTVADHKATLTVPASINGKVVNTFVFSTPIFLGEVTVAGGTISFDVSVLPAGDHKMVIVDKANGDVLAWATFTKSDAAIAPSFSKTINADVANGTGTPADGEFSLTNLSSSTVNLVNPALVNGKSIVSGQLGDFKVTDMRVVTKAGWTLKTDVAQFVKGADTIANSALGIDPKVVAQTAGTAPVMGAAQVSGSAVYPWNFATLAGGSYSGVSTYNADLVFTAPVGSAAGTYTSTLTLTLISN